MLHVASSSGHLATVHFLLECNATANSMLDEQDKWGNTALHLAARKRHAQVRDPSTRERQRIMLNILQVAMALMQAGVDVDVANCVRQTSLVSTPHVASITRSVVLVMLDFNFPYRIILLAWAEWQL